MTQIPSWLTSDYLKNVLEHFLNLKDLKIKNFNVTPCNNQGEGFLSLLLRISIDYEINSKSSSIPIILKCECDNELALSIIGSSGYDLQSKEIKFFDSIAGKMTKILKPSKVIPDGLFVDKSRGTFMMEDLRLLNFTMADRLVGLDEKHVKISLEKIAKFHAASLKILSEDKKAFEGFDVGTISRKVTKVYKFYNLGFKAAIDEVSSWEGFEEISNKMKNLSEVFMERTLRTFDVDEGDLNVLNHGDVWTTNLMFKYEEGEVVDAVLIDFQFAHFISAAMDLIHFFFSSLNDELFTPAKTEEFFQFYYYELKKNLEKLKLKVENFPSLHGFMIEYHKKLFYAFTFLLTVNPVMTSNDPENSFEMHHSDHEKSEDFRKRVVKAPRYQLACKRFLPYFDRLGVLDL